MENKSFDLYSFIQTMNKTENKKENRIRHNHLNKSQLISENTILEKTNLISQNIHNTKSTKALNNCNKFLNKSKKSTNIHEINLDISKSKYSNTFRYNKSISQCATPEILTINKFSDCKLIESIKQHKDVQSHKKDFILQSLKLKEKIKESTQLLEDNKKSLSSLQAFSFKIWKNNELLLKEKEFLKNYIHAYKNQIKTSTNLFANEILSSKKVLKDLKNDLNILKEFIENEKIDIKKRIRNLELKNIQVSNMLKILKEKTNIQIKQKENLKKNSSLQTCAICATSKNTPR